MELQEIKRFPIGEIMSKYNVKQGRRYSNYQFYFAPWRDEKTPSLKWDCNFNLWIDYADDSKKGSNIDLIMALENCSFNQALEKLKSMFESTQNISVSFQRNNNPAPLGSNSEKPTFSLVAVSDLSSPHLIELILNRKIPIEIARKYLHEVKVIHNKSGRKNCLIGLNNLAGGYELRGLNQFKTSVGVKDCSLITTKNNNVSIVVTEGMMDTLSAIMLLPTLIEKSTCDFLTLNTTKLCTKAIPILAKYDTVLVALDLDRSGKEATQKILRALPQATDISAKYDIGKCKDLNDYLIYSNIEKRKSRGLHL
jgi:5S rRNA maturation endonuclease (ribonuclease M5)